MATSLGALCTDFYINQKLALKMDMPAERETILHFFDHVRKAVPAMNRFRRYDGELALESSRRNSEYRWLSLRRTSVRSGHVNPQSMEDAYAYHRLLLEISPYHLTISPLDVDYLELMFGFDLECKENHDRIIYEALFADTPMANLLAEGDANGKILDVQPVFGQALDESGELQAYFEVKTRPKSRRGSSRGYRHEPISLFLTLRKYGPVEDVKQLQSDLTGLAASCEQLAADRLVPDLLAPIAQRINAGRK